MPITTAFPNSLKKELFDGTHNFKVGGNSFKLALYTSSATLGATTTAYTASNEVSNSGTNYTTGGNALDNINPALDATTGVVDFADEVFSAVSLTARGCLIYNDTAAGDPAVYVGDFGADKMASSGDFTIVFPSPAAATAILRIA
jgi:hypothetical protein